MIAGQILTGSRRDVSRKCGELPALTQARKMNLISEKRVSSSANYGQTYL